jgi:hypothetical protein
MMLKGQVVYAHRLSWTLANGRPVPEGMFVCHTCDVTCCVNPAHLFIGTNADNMADAKRKGRTRNAPRRGVDHAMVKLSVEQVLAIRKRFAAGDKQVAIAAAFGVTQANVWAIGNRKTWQHIGDHDAV